VRSVSRSRYTGSEHATPLGTARQRRANAHRWIRQVPGSGRHQRRHARAGERGLNRSFLKDGCGSEPGRSPSTAAKRSGCGDRSPVAFPYGFHSR
jgi:hypothetical protein